MHPLLVILNNAVGRLTDDRVRWPFKYQYQPLDPEKRQIRLLRLLPPRGCGRLSGELYIVSLDDRPVFDALSYVWSHEEPHNIIILERKHGIRIRHNLRRALRAIRNKNEPVTIWTDAICIDQSNRDEVEHQVQLMRQIYSQASVVRAWIDQEVDLEEEIFKVLSQPSNPDLLDLLQRDAALWYPVIWLLGDRYWRRVWIQQELILASEVAIHCRREVLGKELTQRLLETPKALGTHTTTLAEADSSDPNVMKLSNDLNYWINGGVGSPPFFGGISTARQVRKNWESTKAVWEGGYSYDFPWACLLDLFLATAKLETSEERDKVYGVLGLALDFEEGDISVHYDWPLVQVYAQVPDMFIKKHNSLAFLCFFEVGERIEGHPTWLPTPDRRAVIHWPSIWGSPTFMPPRASGASIHSEGRTLSAFGSRVDSIGWTSGRDPLQLEAISKWKRQLEGQFNRVRSSIETSFISDCDEIISLLCPWSTEVHWANFGLRKRSGEEKRAAVTKLFKIADNSMPKLTLNDIRLGVDLSGHATSQEVEVFHSLSLAIGWCRFVATSKQRLGTLHYSSLVRPGDEIWILYGCPLPIILRPRPGGSSGYIWIGCIQNMPGLTDGEGLEGFPKIAETGFKNKGLETQQIDIW
jgi:hypothetical protein